MRILGALILFAGLAGPLAQAQTEVLDAQIEAISDTRITLRIGTEPLVAADGPETRIWISKAKGTRELLKAGMLVRVRLKTDADPPVLREISDRATGAWLDKVRKEPQRVEVVKATARELQVRLDGNTPFTYRLTDKSKIRLTNGDPSEINSLKAGQWLYVKGRLLSNLDTWVVEMQDKPYEEVKPAAKSSSSTGKSTAPSLPSTGKLEGSVLGLVTHLNMLDILVGTNTIHITVNSDTKWYLNGKKSDSRAVRKFQPVKVAYKRDRLGRIIATRIDLS